MPDETTPLGGMKPEVSRPHRLSRSGWLAGALLLVGLAATLAPERRTGPPPILLDREQVDTQRGPIGFRLEVLGHAPPGLASFDQATAHCACAVYVSGQVSFILEVENRGLVPLSQRRVYPSLLEVNAVVPPEKRLERVIDVPALRETPSTNVRLELDLVDEPVAFIPPGATWRLPLYLSYEGDGGEFLARDGVSIELSLKEPGPDGSRVHVVESASLELPRRHLTWTPWTVRTVVGLVIVVLAGWYLLRDAQRSHTDDESLTMVKAPWSAGES